MQANAAAANRMEDGNSIELFHLTLNANEPISAAASWKSLTGSARLFEPQILRTIQNK